jgi:hypothetical protein
VPYPANYGGVIDVFYKIRAMHKAGLKVVLHCFEYGRGEQEELKKYCEEIFYYRRDTSFLQHFGKLPYIIASRRSAELLENLKKNNFPVLFEGLHTCALLDHPSLKDRFTIFRESNIEHEYYEHLAKAETDFLKRIYFKREARKLKNFESIVKHASLMLTVSREDTVYFKKQYPGKHVEYLPSFHAHDEITSKTGKGDYILYHGNLAVSENLLAAEYLIREVFSQLDFPVVIAGLNPPHSLSLLISASKNIRLIANPDEEEMQRLISNAQVNCLYTHQATGLKLKLLNVLYSGRYCICNSNMVHGTGLEQTCIIANEPAYFLSEIKRIRGEEFALSEISLRKNLLEENYDNKRKAEKLISLLP